MAGRGRVVGGRLVAALLATGLVLCGGLLALLGLVALGDALLRGATPVPFALAVLGGGVACLGVAWLLGQAASRA